MAGLHFSGNTWGSRSEWRVCVLAGPNIQINSSITITIPLFLHAQKHPPLHKGDYINWASPGRELLCNST